MVDLRRHPRGADGCRAIAAQHHRRDRPVADCLFGAGASENNAGAPLSAESCTIIGKVHSTTLLKISNCLIDAETQVGDGWAAPVIASRRQQGCVRFSYVPFSAIVPRRYRSHPQDAEEAACLRPQFVSAALRPSGLRAARASLPGRAVAGR